MRFGFCDSAYEQDNAGGSIHWQRGDSQPTLQEFKKIFNTRQIPLAPAVAEEHTAGTTMMNFFIFISPFLGARLRNKTCSVALGAQKPTGK